MYLFTKLRKFQIYVSEQHVIWSSDHLLEILRSLGSTKNLTITYLDICLDNDFDEQGTEDILHKGIKI